MEYKKLIQSQEFRLKILRLLRFIPDKSMIALQYWLKLRRIPKIANAERFSEKIQWYKLNYRNNDMTICADKYGVREYIKRKQLDSALIPIYGVYDKFTDIDFSDLPATFILKTTNGSGTNYLCKDKSKINIIELSKQVNEWLKRDMYAAGREWAYKSVTPKIIIEELLVNESNPEAGINDYKFLCFGGKPEYVILDTERYVDHKRNIYDLEWNLLDVSTDKQNINEKIEKPKNLKEMIEIARILSEDFPFVRVDLYTVNNKVYFGELTFYPWTGYIAFEPDSFDFELGDKFVLPVNNYK